MSKPLRRSQRGQPVISGHNLQGVQSTSTGDAVHTRQTRLEEDVTRDQLDRLESSEIDSHALQTRFYCEFTRGEAMKWASKVYGKAKRAVAQVNQELYRVGDTVLVSTQANDSSVAVITSIWAVADGEKVLCLNVSLHWFLRPKEMPTVRVKRSHKEAEIYYTLSRNVIAAATKIAGHCSVSGQASVSTPNEQSFTCLHAVESQKGIYYDFDWDDHRRAALKFSKFWENNSQWDVVAINLPDTPQKQDNTTDVYSLRQLNALSSVQEEEEPGETDEEHEPESPSKRKRKRDARGMRSPIKRAKLSVQQDVHDPEGEVLRNPDHFSSAETHDHQDLAKVLPQTPSRRGREKASGTLSDPRAKSSRTGDKTLTESGDEHSQDKRRAVLVEPHGTRLLNLKEPKTPSRRGRRKGATARRFVESSSGDEVNDPDYTAGIAEEIDSDIEGGVEGEPEETEAVPRTPSRRTRSSLTTTPRKRRATVVAPTPHSKAALRTRAKRKQVLAVRPPPPDGAYDLQVQLQKLPEDPWLRAMHTLHVAAQPSAYRLPCREEEYAKILRHVSDILEFQSSGCIYISGVPGTGKTATVHAVVRELKRMAQDNETNPFTYVEINGLRIPEPGAAYNLLWEALSGHDVSREGHLKITVKESVKKLGNFFDKGEQLNPSCHTCIVLMDELDQLMTASQDVVYNFFNWPTLTGAKLIVLAVANTMDLPERVMNGKVRSRLGLFRVNFRPYTTPQLEQIIRTRLQCSKEGLPSDTPDVIGPDGIKFAAMKVSSITGDARRALDICRKVVEYVYPQRRAARTDDVKKVIAELQSSPHIAYLQDLSFHERLMLASLLRCMNREGVDGIKWGDLQRQHLLNINVLAEEEDTTTRPTTGELGIVLESLAATRAVLVEETLHFSRRPDDEKRVFLNTDRMDLEKVLGEMGGAKWKNVLNI